MEGRKPRPTRSLTIALATVVELQSDRAIQAKAANVGAGGCYLEVETPLPMRTAVRVELTHGGSTFTAFGDVVRSEPHGGMAVRFRAVESRQMEILKGWLLALDRPDW
jgi:hypothetical protein